MTSAGRYWRTIRHLKARQIMGRVVFRLGAPVPGRRAAPAVRNSPNSPILPARRTQSLSGEDCFLFLNEAHRLVDVGWDSPGIARLWRYNLHYFDDLNAFGAEGRVAQHAALVDRWIAENPPAGGSGWEPYPTSLRIVNWIKWFNRTGHAEKRWLESLAHQVRWLGRRVEWHLLGNHLFANAKAILAAGLYFQGPEAEEWRARATKILSRELPEQVLADGGHFERSPMYHRLMLEDLLDLLWLGRSIAPGSHQEIALQNQLRRRASEMLAWAHVMQFDDGSMPRFNDSAEGVAPSFPELQRVAMALEIDPAFEASAPMQHLGSSGYVRMSWDGAVAFLDVAPVGPDYLPGHAHADTLSFELAVNGELIVVNRGTSCYGNSQRRSYERGTGAHSTVQVLDEDSSETWGGFRVGRRAHPQNVTVETAMVRGEHDGYEHLPGRPRHRRAWTRSSRAMEVVDEVTADVPAVARFHLAPGVGATPAGHGRWRLRAPSGVQVELEIVGAATRILDSQHATAFGTLERAATLEVDLADRKCIARWRW